MTAPSARGSPCRPTAPRLPRRRPGSAAGCCRLYVTIAFVFLLDPDRVHVRLLVQRREPLNISWNGFTLRTGSTVCAQPDVCTRVRQQPRSSAASPPLAATALGTAIAIALVRYRLRGRSWRQPLLFMPMATPEVVIERDLAAQFLTAAINKGLVTIISPTRCSAWSFDRVTVRRGCPRPTPRSRRSAVTLRVAARGVPGVSRSRCCSRASSRRRCCRSASASTTSSSRTSRRAMCRPSRSTSTWRRSAASRRQERRSHRPSSHRDRGDLVFQVISAQTRALDR